MIYQQEIYPDDFEQKLEAFEIIEKAFNSGKIGTEVFLQANDVLIKAKSDLVPKKTFAKRSDGKVYLTTVWVNPNTKETLPKEGSGYVEAPIGTPETIIGESVKVTKQNGEVIEGVVSYLYAWVDSKSGENKAEIHVKDFDGKSNKFLVNKINKFEKFTSEIKEPVDGVVDNNGYKIIKKLGGSTGALLVEKDGVQYVKKTAANKEQLSSEMRAINYMSQIGVPVPIVHKYVPGDATYLEYIGGKTLGEYIDSANLSDLNNVLTEVSKHFVAQALFANHDAVGLSFDNIMVKPDGSVVFVDLGGSMGFRAQGEKKESWENWNSGIGIPEFNSMLNADVNKECHSVFATGMANLGKQNFPSDDDEEPLSIKIEKEIAKQLQEIKDKNPNWFSSPSTQDSKKLKERLETALMNFSSKKEDIYIEQKFKDLSYTETLTYRKVLSLYEKEIETAKKYGRDDIAKFYEDFASYMFFTDSEFENAKTVSVDQFKSYSGNDKDFIDQCPGLAKAHMYAIRRHTDTSSHMNPVLRSLCKGMSDGYNISFRDKTTVEFNKEEFEKLKSQNSEKLMNVRLIVDLFARMKTSDSKYYRRDATLYRGIFANDSTIETIGSVGENIFCDAGISSNAQNYDKAFERPTVIATSMAEGVDVQTVGTHPNELETIMKPFNIQQVVVFKDCLSLVSSEDSKGRYQVRVEAPGLIPINL